ncbi:MAG: hypothetical protein QOH98_719 [Methylobacteriaceae bacterium]|nr:hypothetical protein [Methylobacteriaceae bacterium]
MRWGSLPGLLIFVLGIFLIWLVNANWILSHSHSSFSLTLAILIALLVVIGIAVKGRVDGVLIDNRNRVSLAKFQATLWTILVIGALICVASHNLASGESDALNFRIPPELLTAMGISAASFVAAPMVLSLKTQSPPTPAGIIRATAFASTRGANLQPAGKVFGLDSPTGASWTDMVRGEELENVDSPDLGKIQQLFISLLLVGIYAVAVWNLLSTAGKLELPPLNENFVWLLGVSHASYIAYKAAPHS